MQANPAVIAAYLGSADVSPLLHVEDLELAYGEMSACRDVSFHVDEGEIVTLIGANGAGKSTTLRAVAGVLSRAPAQSASAGMTSRGCPRTSARASASRSFPKGGRYFRS